jgi:hypothetical protein
MYISRSQRRPPLEHRRTNIAPNLVRGSARLRKSDDILFEGLSLNLFHMALFRRMPSVDQLAIPGVSILILFLAYSSQYLFYYIDPGPLTKSQALWFNGFVFGIWWCYDRACTVDPGPRGWVRKIGLSGDEDDGEDAILEKGKRWCRKCEAVKPPRAHHCKQCGRYA